MNTRCCAIPILILTLSLVCLLNHSKSALYPPGTWDHSTMATTSTLEATHIVVGEVTHVSFVDDNLMSIVTVRVDKDIKAEIKRVAAEDTNPVGNVSEDKGDTTQPTPGEEADRSNLGDDTALQTVSFIQLGGPWPDGGWAKASGMPLLKKGDNVFLRLKSTGPPVIHSGKEYNSYIDAHGTVYPVQTAGNDVDQYIIKKGWQRLDFNVSEMTRIVRATLEQPETMRTLEQGVNNVWQAVTEEAHTQTIMNKVVDIEDTSNLPSFDDNDQ